MVLLPSKIWLEKKLDTSIFSNQIFLEATDVVFFKHMGVDVCVFFLSIPEDLIKFVCICCLYYDV